MKARSPRFVAVATFAALAAIGGAFVKQATERGAAERRLEAAHVAESVATALERELEGVFTQLAAIEAGTQGRLGRRVEAVFFTAGGRAVASIPPRATALDAEDLASFDGLEAAVYGPLRGPDGARKVAARLPTRSRDVMRASLVGVLDLNGLLDTHLSPRLSGYRYLLASEGPRAATLARSSGAALEHPLRRELRAGDGRWRIELVPLEGWIRPAPFALHVVIALVIALAGALLAYDIARQRTTLRLALAQRGTRLREANRRLVDEVQQREAFEKRFSHASFHDADTGLPNRRLLESRLEQALVAARGAGSGIVAFAALSLERLKPLTDRLGAGAADEVMVQAARRLEARAQAQGATLGRLGDADFGLVFAAAPRETVIAGLDAVHRAFDEAFVVEGQRLFVGAHAGVAFSSGGYDHPDDLARGAHIALSAARRQRLPQATFDPATQEQVISRHQLETDLHGVAERGELRIVFQPVVSLADGRIRGLEALVRWQHPVEGLVPPGRFIPLAEETGLIVPITRWMLREACRNAAAWRAAGRDDFYVSVNLSAHDMREPGVAEYVRTVLEEAGLASSALRLEVTESAMIDNMKGAVELLERLRAMGVRILLDDFGTGYSSLSYLHRFRIDYLKIDQSFVMRMTPDAKSSGVVRAILNLAEGMEIETIAEGIEDAGTAALLRELRCAYGQGYHFSRPVDPETAGRLLAGGRLG